MPLGRYSVLGDDGTPAGTEEFRCAPGPMGWRYFSEVQTDHHETLDVAVDADWRIARARADTGAHTILLEPRGEVLAGYRDGEELEIPYGPDMHLDIYTPATNVITAKRLSGTTEIDVVYLEPVTLEPSLVRQRYELMGPEDVQTPVGVFEAVRWRFIDVGSGWTGDLWIAGDVVVAYEHLFTLDWYDPGANGARVRT